MRHVLAHAGDRDWLVALDDDNPPRTPNVLCDLIARALGKPVADLPRQPRLSVANLALDSRAIVDAYRGRMGLTVRPAGKP
jgi:hypothetical protein